jgi:sugar lactone lactonase YvrE
VSAVRNLRERGDPARRLLPLTVIPVPGPGAEDVLVGGDGRVWTGTADGGLHVHDPGDGSVTTVSTTRGRPMGLEWLPDGRIVVCDARRGLLAVDPVDGAVEVLATEAEGRRFLVTNNAAVAPDGTVWFTDSSAFYDIDAWRDDLIAHTRSGRLLRRTADGAVETVLGGLAFANGVALSPSGDAVLVAESATRRICRVATDGEGAGSVSAWVEDLPGHPDNMSLGSDGLVWVTLAAPADPTLRVLQRGPDLLRRLVVRAPERLKPGPRRSVRVMALTEDAQVAHDLEFDPTAWHFATGVREHGGRVWLGSLLEPAIAVGEVPASAPHARS